MTVANVDCTPLVLEYVLLCSTHVLIQPVSHWNNQDSKMGTTPHDISTWEFPFFRHEGHQSDLKYIDSIRMPSVPSSCDNLQTPSGCTTPQFLCHWNCSVFVQLCCIKLQTIHIYTLLGTTIITVYAKRSCTAVWYVGIGIYKCMNTQKRKPIHLGIQTCSITGNDNVLKLRIDPLSRIHLGSSDRILKGELQLQTNKKK